MSPRRIAPGLLSLPLGVGAAVLVACGGGGTQGGIPPTSAERLKEDFEDVRQAVDSGRCEDVGGQLRQVGERVDNLPPSVDNALQDRLREAVSRLNERAIEDCNDNQVEVQTTTTEEIPEEPPVTVTAPTTTTEVPPQTTAPQTTPETTPAPGLPPDDDVENDDAGGTRPEVSP